MSLKVIAEIQAVAASRARGYNDWVYAAYVGLEVSSVEFEWDPHKAASNLKKHGVSFYEAATVFGDALSVTYVDPDHSSEECRFVSIGHSSAGRLLVVAHGDRGNRIRSISARRGTPRERKLYEEDAVW